MASKIVEQAARKALAAASGMCADATQLLADEVRKNEDLRREILEPLIYRACHDAICKAIGNSRNEAWTGTKQRRSLSDQKIPQSLGAQLRQIAGANLLMFPLPGGRLLGQATRDEVMAGAVFYATQAKDMAHKARWLKAIHDTMGNAATVADAMGNDVLTIMQREAA